MTYRNPWVVGAVLAIVIALFATTLTLKASANPFEFLVENQGTTAPTATTTLSFITAGFSTSTTIAFDTYANGGGNGYATNDAALEIQFTASSSATIYNWYYEYAQGGPSANCVNVPASCDWYADNLQANTVGSTTPGTYVLNSINRYQFTYASSTQGAGLVTANQTLPVDKIVTVQVPTRYVRAVFSIPPGSLPGAVWASFVGRKQTTR